jgi:SAM-dependent methyltransferase
MPVAGENERVTTAQRPFRVLDAGCGADIRVPLPDGAYIVGIDISQEQLDRNTVIDEKILGDVQTYPLEPESFDLIVCWDTLEHLPKPRLALDNLSQALAPEGTLIIAGPDVLSLKGVITKWTPHIVHRWAYRTFLPFSSQDPFPTYLRFAARPSAVMDWAKKRGLAVESLELTETGMQRLARSRVKLTGWRWRAVCVVVRVLTFGIISASHTDFVLVLRKWTRSSAAAQAHG